MNTQNPTLATINRTAVKVLVRELGIVQTLRFLNQYRTGAGDYTQDRDEYLRGLSVREIADQMRRNAAGDHPRP